VLSDSLAAATPTKREWIEEAIAQVREFGGEDSRGRTIA
jgi:hypothetical protein